MCLHTVNQTVRLTKIGDMNSTAVTHKKSAIIKIYPRIFWNPHGVSRFDNAANSTEFISANYALRVLRAVSSLRDLRRCDERHFPYRSRYAVARKNDCNVERHFWVERLLALIVKSYTEKTSYKLDFYFAKIEKSEPQPLTRRAADSPQLSTNHEDSEQQWIGPPARSSSSSPSSQ